MQIRGPLPQIPIAKKSRPHVQAFLQRGLQGLDQDVAEKLGSDSWLPEITWK